MAAHYLKAIWHLYSLTITGHLVFPLYISIQLLHVVPYIFCFFHIDLEKENRRVWRDCFEQKKSPGTVKLEMVEQLIKANHELAVFLLNSFPLSRQLLNWTVDWNSAIWAGPDHKWSMQSRKFYLHNSSPLSGMSELQGLCLYMTVAQIRMFGFGFAYQNDKWNVSCVHT